MTGGGFGDAGTSGASGAQGDAGRSNGGVGGGGAGSAAAGVAGGAVAGNPGVAGGSAAGAGSGAGGEGGRVEIPPGLGVGEACGPDAGCRAGLSCSAGVCEPSGETERGGPCVLSAECVADSQCVGASCVAAGSGVAGDNCTADADCAGGLRCAFAGLTLACAPEGSIDVGGACATPSDCFAGLSCVSGECIPAMPGVPVFGSPSFERVACPDRAAEGETVRALFEVPGAAGGGASDFFSLPFPNDIRIRDGHPDLTGFPTPGSALFGYDPLERYVTAVETRAAGWGANPAVIFRFSGRLDWSTFRSGSGTVWFADVTPGESYGRVPGMAWQYHESRTNAVCSDWLAIRPPDGTPLLPGHTYAAWLYDSGKAYDGSEIERSAHFEAMLEDAVPGDAALAAAWQRYKPLRDFVASPPAWWQTLREPLAAPDAARMLAASVITVDDVVAPMTALAGAVEAEPVPAATSWVRCGGDEPSPCPQADAERACGGGSAGYDEYHALVSLPVFQQGEAPYLDLGGAIAAEPVRTEAVCMALTVPSGTAPAAGWPLVVFAHGTGGSFRSHVSPDVAGVLSSVTTSAGDVSFAVLGIDQASHGPRRGDSQAAPDDLFYNFANPDAARGNPMQGAADQLSVTRFAAALDIDAATSGGDPIRVDPTRIVFFGHSQGATAASLALPFDDAGSAAVLSGHGASIKNVLLTKRNPVDLASTLPFLVGDPAPGADGGTALAGGIDHPALTLISQWLDPADPLNFARLVALEPDPGHAPKHVFLPYGQGDTYSPPTTIEIYALAGGFDEAEPDASVTSPDDLDLAPPSGEPVAGNVTVAGTPYTLALRQYAPPSGSDGHFVAFDVAAASADLSQFLGLAARGDLPAVGP